MKLKVGIYNPYLSTRGGGEKVCLAMAEALSQDKKYDVHLISHEEVDVESLAQYFNLDLKKVSLDVIDSHGKFTKLIDRLPIPRGIKNILIDARMVGRLRKQAYDIFINNCYQSNLPNVGAKGIYMCMFPQKIKFKDEKISLPKKIYKYGLQVLDHIFVNHHKRHAIYSYNIVTANSKYTQGYINKYWGIDSVILYPICEDMQLKGVAKKKVILNVGRFFGLENNAHHKRQDVLVDTFIKMKDLHEEGWELHLAGSAGDDVSALRFIMNTMQKAQGYPIFIHTNLPFKEMKNLFNEARIYWHATGYGSDPNQYPEKQEHFGITTVEAMSAGVIPVVINTAGQAEVVNNSVNGYLWKTPDELATATRTSIQTELPLKKSIRDTSLLYSKKSFEYSLERIMLSIE